MARCLIALGGNLDTSESLFAAALSKLERPGVKVVQMSDVQQTQPVGSSAGDAYLNAAATVDCALSPDELLMALHLVESQFGRTRTIHWGPRTLDLDLLLYEDQVIDQSDLVVPHPAMWYRRFVLDPAVHVAADMVHPILKQTISELHRKLQPRPIRLAVRLADQQSAKSLNLMPILERLSVAIPEIEWLPTKDGASAHEPCFSHVAIHGRALHESHRTQPANAQSRLINIFAVSDESAMDQLTQLSAAILGDIARK